MLCIPKSAPGKPLAHDLGRSRLSNGLLWCIVLSLGYSGPSILATWLSRQVLRREKFKQSEVRFPVSKHFMLHVGFFGYFKVRDFLGAISRGHAGLVRECEGGSWSDLKQGLLSTSKVPLVRRSLSG